MEKKKIKKVVIKVGSSLIANYKTGSPKLNWINSFINDLISDEILLSIPMVPMHDYDCIKEINEQEIVEGKSENPFAILKKIKIADGGKE